MEFSHGRVALHGRRLILHDLKALGLFRRDLIETMGQEQAQRILTRKGFFWGQSDAAALQRLFHWDSPEEWLRAGTMLSRIAGLCEAELRVREFDLLSGRVELDMVWHNSSEVEQHLAEFAEAAYPVCWVLVGYASGYASFCAGQSVYFLETHCQAAGAPGCVAVGKDQRSWGREIEPYLSFFQAADIAGKVRDLTAQLERQQAELALQPPPAADAPTPNPSLLPVEAQSPAFRRTLELASRVAKFDTTVLITGETGTGKEVLARYLHQTSPRARHAFLAINCSALPETLLESELFGHRAGAFTGATRNHAGLFEEAGGGTVFLDEIGDISPAMQVKLLRVLQEREVRRVGESHARPVDVRVISATNQDLEQMVAEGRFREDLFFRLHVVRIQVPPLRERRDDILPLARHLLKGCAQRLNLPALRLAPACLDALLNYAWPGNVRELENVLEHAAVMSGNDTITPDLLPLTQTKAPSFRAGAGGPRTLAAVEEAHIREMLQLAGGNRAQAARILGIGEATLYRKLRRETSGDRPQ
jgi:DNA-binding NtrC family response regulator